MENGFFRVASLAPKVEIANPELNASRIIDALAEAFREGTEMAVCPELCVTGYTCADLFHNNELLIASVEAVRKIAEASRDWNGMLLWIGAPLRNGDDLYNCAIAISGGKVLAVIPKTYLPTYNEFYESRWFRPSSLYSSHESIKIWSDGEDIPFGNEILLETPSGVKVGAELCEDLWAPSPRSTSLALCGAEVIANLSASDDIIGKYDYLLKLVEGQSARIICGYVYSSAGFGESSTDLVFDAKLLIAENGTLLARNKRWVKDSQSVYADLDIEAIRRDRMHLTTFGECTAREGHSIPTIHIAGQAPLRKNLLRDINPQPFVPRGGKSELSERCEEIINIQSSALAKRLEATGCRTLVVGISGGLDSTLALLVAVRTFQDMGYDLKGIHGITMPGFGTTGRTYSNAMALMENLGISVHEIPIADAVNQHFKDIGHDSENHDVTYENSQARERTQILMDLANRFGGMVLGTGDLSELALGWATYNGDHMSMYAVNAGVPKTLVRHLTSYFAENVFAQSKCRQILRDIISTPVSPELLPPSENGEILQATEDLVGPYELHDFFLYYMLRFGFSPRRIFFLACHAFDGRYSKETIKKWLKIFFWRFFSQQFKRSCLPDGPKVGSVCLSPRGDWRMPSDASSYVWLKEIDLL